MRQLRLATIVAIAISGCRFGIGTSTNVQHAPIQIEVRDSAGASAADTAILTSIVNDMVTYDGDDNAIEPPIDRPELIYLDFEFNDNAPADSVILRKHEVEKWEAIKYINQKTLLDACENLRQRTSDSSGLRIVCSDARVLTRYKLDPEDKMHRRPISICKPGFSSDNSVCVVFAIVPWSKHHAEATYILDNQAGSWTIRLRQFVIYL